MWNLANDTIFRYIVPILYDGSLAVLKYLSVIVCLLVALEKNITIFGTLTHMARSSCLQVLTVAKLVLSRGNRK